MKISTYVIGRSPHADIQLSDPGIDLHHAELVVTSSGLFHLSDCASSSGSWLRLDHGEWQPLRQQLIERSSLLRFGAREIDTAALLRLARSDDDDSGPASGGGGHGSGSGSGSGAAKSTITPVKGAVQRDPVTGAIIRRRI